MTDKARSFSCADLSGGRAQLRFSNGGRDHGRCTGGLGETTGTTPRMQGSLPRGEAMGAEPQR